ncbi:MAG: UDP-3-O-[3-hydroxymyristoyl] N-acetylglucosamine deacetylase, partial [bacterium]|nr:UDP-3-O-[3-hydroxymyristoyl] N-acetylglucosamine deacetylase [bacterium]
MASQQTIAKPVEIEGRGLFTGSPAIVRLRPADPGAGITLIRTDQKEPVSIRARVGNVAKRARRTTLKIGNVSVETVEHCMSALAGLQIDNALIQINGPELPCGDGSAAPFVNPIMEVGTQEQEAPRRIYRLTEPLLVEEGD